MLWNVSCKLESSFQLVFIKKTKNKKTCPGPLDGQEEEQKDDYMSINATTEQKDVRMNIDQIHFSTNKKHQS